MDCLLIIKILNRVIKVAYCPKICTHCQNVGSVVDLNRILITWLPVHIDKLPFFVYSPIAKGNKWPFTLLFATGNWQEHR